MSNKNKCCILAEINIWVDERHLIFQLHLCLHLLCNLLIPDLWLHLLCSP